MRIYVLEFLVLYDYAHKYCDHKQCEGGDMFLVCHVTFCEHMFKGLCEFMSGKPSESPSCHV